MRADVVHERLVAMGFTGDERTTRRAVAAAKAAYGAGHRRGYRPWITEPGLWLQFDWGAGPMVFGPDGRPRPTLLFCAWLAWSRFRVVLPTWDRTLGTLLTCLDATLRRVGGAPTYALTDNEKTVTVEHVAGIAVRHPMMVAAGRHYGLTVHTCVPFDPESKGGSEATVRIAKADLVPTKANLRPATTPSPSWRRRATAFCDKVNARPHRETGRVPAEALAVERRRLHAAARPPRTPPRWARPGRSAPIRRSGSGRCATPPRPDWSASEVWVRVDGEELSWSRPDACGARLATGHGRAGRGRPARGCPPRATRGSTLSTTPTTPRTRDGSPGPPRPRAAQPGREGVPGPGAGRARLAGRGRRGRRATGPVEDGRRTSSWPPWSAPRPSTPRWASPRPRAGSPRPTCWPSSSTAPTGASIADLVHADEDHSAQPGTAPGPPSAPATPVDQAPAPTLKAEAVLDAPTAHQPGPCAGAAAARGAAGGADPDAAALPARRRPRGARHRPGATLGPRRGAAGAARRGDPRPGRGHPADAPQGRRPAGREDLRRPGGSRLLDPARTQTGLATLEWIGRAENLAIAGPSGTGKTHFVEAIAHAVIDAGMRVAWFTLESLTATIGRAAVGRDRRQDHRPDHPRRSDRGR